MIMIVKLIKPGVNDNDYHKILIEKCCNKLMCDLSDKSDEAIETLHMREMHNNIINGKRFDHAKRLSMYTRYLSKIYICTGVDITDSNAIIDIFLATNNSIPIFASTKCVEDEEGNITDITWNKLELFYA